MKVADKRNVDARVGVDVTDEGLKGRIRAGDQSIEAPLRVSHEMVATLSGPGFAVTPVTPGKQSVAEGFTTVWDWEVEAKVQGTQELEATLYALVPDGASATAQQRIDSYTQKINVSVKPQTWSEWLISVHEGIDSVKGIVIALASSATLALGWLGISLKRGKRSAAKKARVRHVGPRGRRGDAASAAPLVTERGAAPLRSRSKKTTASRRRPCPNWLIPGLFLERRLPSFRKGKVEASALVDIQPPVLTDLIIPAQDPCNRV